MKLKQLLSAGFLFLSLGAVSQGQPFRFSDKIVSAEAGQYLKLTRFSEKASYSTYDLTYQRMEWNIDPAVKYISGKITSIFTSRIAGLQTVRFDLNQNMAVDSVKSGSKILNFTHQNNILEILLPRKIDSGDADSLSVFYRGMPDPSGFGSFVQAEHSGSPVIWTLSEPYGAKDWWPCKQSLADKIDSADIFITCPEIYITASNGVLVSESVTGGERTMHWRHRFPIATYLVAIAATNYERYSDFLELGNGQKIEILNYVYPENLESAKEWTPQCIDVMNLYNKLFGTYPFAAEKYGHAQFGWGGGMEHQTMTFLVDFSFELMAHELAHQWFGDCITLDTWHDIWLNEGFATFATGLAYENLLGGAWYPVWKKVMTEKITGQPDGSVYVADTADISKVFSNRLSYCKGAYILHMLRWVLGDENFFKALRSYASDPEIVYGFTSQEKLVKHFEAAGDTCLAEFFNDWYYGEGYPVYSANYSQTGEDTLRLNLFQTTTHSSVSFFEMPVPVRLYNLQKTDSADFRLDNRYSGQKYILDPGFLVGSIKIDPDLWLISKTSTITGSPAYSLPETFSVFPNPFTNTIGWEAPSGQKVVEASLFSSEGKLLQHSGGNLSLLQLGGLPPGIYILQARTDKNTFREKLVKK